MSTMTLTHDRCINNVQFGYDNVTFTVSPQSDCHININGRDIYITLDDSDREGNVSIRYINGEYTIISPKYKETPLWKTMHDN